MSKPTKSEHMSRLKFKSDNLHPLQKLIVLHLAENEPQTINQTVRALSKSYKPTWIAFHSLEKKKLIRKTDAKSYRGREYPLFWLTDEGMIMALMEGACSDRLLEQTKNLYPENKSVHCFLEIVPFIDPEVMSMVYSSVKGKGKLGFVEIATLVLSQAAIPMDIEVAKKLTATVKKYPDEYNKLKIAFQMMINQLSQLISD